MSLCPAAVGMTSFCHFSRFRLPANLPEASVALAAEVSNRAASQNILHLELMRHSAKVRGARLAGNYLAADT